MEHRTRFTIHRGLQPDQRTPNTFDGLFRAGRHGVECDIFLLADRGIGVVHNNDVQRTQEEIESMSTPEFHLLLARERGTQLERTPHPMLHELLFQAHDRGTRLMIELKASTTRRAEELAHATVQEMHGLITSGALLRGGDRGEAYIQRFVGLHSFSLEALLSARHAMHRTKLEMPLGVFWASTFDRAAEMTISQTAQHAAIASSRYSSDQFRSSPQLWALQGLMLAKRIGLDSFNPHESLVTEELVQRTHQHGLEIAPWVVNKPDRIKELRSMGVDNIITEINPSIV